MDLLSADDLEVLQSICCAEDGALRLSSGHAEATVLMADLKPAEQADGVALVSATLMLELSRGYLEAGQASFSVERSRGLGDGAERQLLEAARQANQEAVENGLLEEGNIIGALSQVICAAQNALDSANDSTECNICLAALATGEAAVRPPCEHVFHAACVARWLAVQRDVAEATASDVESSTKAERDALLSECSKVEAKHHDAGDRLRVAEQRQALAAKRVAFAQVPAEKEERHLSLTQRLTASSLGATDSEREALAVDAFGDPVPWEVSEPSLVQQQRDAKDVLQQAKSEEKQLGSRAKWVQQRLEELQQSLASTATQRAEASLPCPVCKEPIDIKKLPEVSVATVDEAPSSAPVPAELLSFASSQQQRREALCRRQEAVTAEHLRQEAAALAAQESGACPPTAEAPPSAPGGSNGCREAEPSSSRGRGRGRGRGSHASSWKVSSWNEQASEWPAQDQRWEGWQGWSADDGSRAGRWRR